MSAIRHDIIEYNIWMIIEFIINIMKYFIVPIDDSISEAYFTQNIKENKMFNISVVIKIVDIMRHKCILNMEK
jgi:hypothetical protein